MGIVVILLIIIFVMLFNSRRFVGGKSKDFPIIKMYKKVNDVKDAYKYLYNTRYGWKNLSFIDLLMKTDKQLILDRKLDVKINGEYKFFNPNDNIYTNGDWIVDYFIYEARMKSARKGYESPFDAYHNNKKYKNLIKKKCKNLDPQCVVQTMYSLRNIIPTCGHESTSYLIELFSTLNIKSLFDACAGWGDRLMASMILSMDRYVGVDPNSNTQDGFREMIDMFGDNSKYCVNLDYMPNYSSQHVFDACFLSPPSYDSEIYSDDVNQSTNMFSNKQNWTELFLKPTIKKISNYSTKYFIVQSIIIDEIFDHVLDNNFKYFGTTAMQFPSRAKPLWIFIKQTL